MTAASKRRIIYSSIGTLIAFATAVAPVIGQGFTQNPAYREFRGPIPIRNMRPYQLLYLQFTPEGPDTLRAGSSRYAVQFDVANNMLAPSPAGGSTVVEDNEEHRLLFSWRRGISLAGGSEVGVFFPVVWRNGGFLDEILRFWHRFLGTAVDNIDNPGGREAFPNFQSTLLLRDSSGNTQVNSGNAFGLGDVSVTWKKEFARHNRSNLAIRLAVKLPTGAAGQILGSGGLDAGFSFDGRMRVGHEFMLFVNVGGAFTGHATRVPNTRGFIPQGILAVEYRPNNRDSFVWQIEGSASAVKTGNRVADDTQVTGTFGYKRVLNSRLLLHAAFSENGDVVDYAAKFLANIGPDFTTTLGLEWRL